MKNQFKRGRFTYDLISSKKKVGLYSMTGNGMVKGYAVVREGKIDERELYLATKAEKAEAFERYDELVEGGKKATSSAQPGSSSDPES